MPDEIAWRPARTSDVPALVALVAAAYRGPGGWTNEIGVVEGERVGADELLTALEDPDSVIAVHEADGEEIVACCQVRRGPSGVAGFGLFAVAPDRQNGGLGRDLLALGRRLAVERFAARTLEITVVSGQDRLIAWYERRGFRATGDTRPFGDDPRDRPLVPGLHFVVMHAVLDDIAPRQGPAAAPRSNAGR